MLLEPYYNFKIKVGITRWGGCFGYSARLRFVRVTEDVRYACGITGRVPVATFMNYSTEFASFTHGRGSIRCVFGGYDRCHNAEEVIERKSYAKDADQLYTSSSIFCAKGACYSVPWDEAEAKMHCSEQNRTGQYQDFQMFFQYGGACLIRLLPIYIGCENKSHAIPLNPQLEWHYAQIAQSSLAVAISAKFCSP